jgi:predicted permease
MASLWQDVRFGVRLLARQPGFTAVALLVLAVGIGANAAAFSLVDTLLLRPRVGSPAGELTGVYSRHRTRPGYRAFSYAEFAALREREDVFPRLAAHAFGIAGLRDGDGTRRVFVDIASAGYFETFGVRPVLGRTFTRAEGRPGADIPVAILSHPLWQRLGGTPDLLGTPIEINTRTYSVVGVAPRGFGGSMVMVTPELWVPTGMYDAVAFDTRNQAGSETLTDPESRHLILVAQLAPGATISSMQPALASLSDALSLGAPETHEDHALELAPLSRLSVSTRPQVDDELTSLTAVILSLSGLVLLIASFNLASMLLARGRMRRREFAIRLAVGGRRTRLVRQLVTEGLVLAAIGGLAGLAVAALGGRLLLLALPPMLPISLVFDPNPDGRVLAATAAFSLLAALLFSVWPALKIARAGTLPDLREQAADGWAGRRGLWSLSSRHVLVMGQLALTLVMLTVAGLFARGTLEAARADPGFSLDRGIIVNLDAALADYDTARSRSLYRDALARLAAQPGVVSAGLASHMPFGEFQENRNIQRAGAPVSLDAPDRAARLVGATPVSVSSGYFDAIGIPLRGGRDFAPGEDLAENGEPIAIIDETLARRLFGSQDPVGQFIQHTGDSAEAPPTVLRVVGVAGGVRAELFEDEPSPFVYRPFGQAFRSNVYLHARTSAPTAVAEADMLPGIREALAALADPLPLVALETRPMFRERNLVLAIMRTGASLFTAFGLAALLLAAVGVYGVKAYLVSQRTREIGVRMALGAAPRNVIAMMLREGLGLMVAGLAIGLGLSVLAGWLVRGMLFQGRALDLPVVGAAAAILVVATLLASWLPARRATAVQPLQALR